jgi:N-acetylneuraminic acid mutarotase
MGVPRTWAGAAAESNAIWVAGGSPANNMIVDNYSDLLQRYTPSANAWTNMPRMPTRRSALSVAAVRGRIYAIGGFGATELAVSEYYDIQMMRWYAGANMPEAKCGMATAVVDDVIYLLGGGRVGTFLNQEGAPGGEPAPQGANSTCYAYSVMQNSWRALAPIIGGLFGASATAIGTKIYVMGGYTSDLTFSPSLVYDIPGDYWSTIEAPDGDLRYQSIVAIDGYVYSFGGKRRLGLYGLGCISRYTPAALTWHALPTTLNVARFGMASAQMGGTAYLLGGTADVTAPAVGTVEMFRPSDLTFYAYRKL